MEIELGTHTPRSLENMSKKNFLLAVENDLALGRCSTAMTGDGDETGVKHAWYIER